MAEDRNNPLVNDLRARSKRLKQDAKDDRDCLLASLGEFMADVYERGGPMTVHECENRQRRHWGLLYALVVGVAGVISAVVNWVWKLADTIKGGS